MLELLDGCAVTRRTRGDVGENGLHRYLRERQHPSQCEKFDLQIRMHAERTQRRFGVGGEQRALRRRHAERFVGGVGRVAKLRGERAVANRLRDEPMKFGGRPGCRVA
ncbi:hypothetical protein [Burkholderia cenocepacia]|uniref:hypothetical protein n=1 Tax=Burkholderia cenocepacia TaxID=95486 RepID=UPI00287405F4|nr:hypothetical protein [Burkholderia cenocepacia]MDS0806590.1 hypothetical protein [Burkholderia cenocepacia]